MSSDVLLSRQFPDPPQPKPASRPRPGRAATGQLPGAFLRRSPEVLRGSLLQEESQDPRDQTQGGTPTNGTQRWQERPWVMEENHTQARQVNREESGASLTLRNC